MRKIIIKTSLIALIIVSAGCAAISETPKILLGTSTRDLEAARKDAVAKEFDIAYEIAFQKVQDILKKNKCKIFYKNRTKGVLVAVNFSGFIDTSEAGIFFTQTEPTKTKIEITSQSQELAKAASKIILSELEKLQTKK